MLKSFFNQASVWGSLGALSLYLTGCLTGQNQEFFVPDTNFSCDPVGGGTFLTKESGVLASLKYLPSSSYRWNGSGSVIPGQCSYANPNDPMCPGGLGLDYAYMAQNGIASTTRFYFADINVVPEQFTLGFPLKSGKTVEDDQGNVLNSYFSLDFQGRIQLGANQPAGWYQFATLSDDGSILNLDVNGDGNLVPVVNNDYWHGAIMQCSTEAVYLQPGQAIKMDLQYFQGAPVTIAMMVMFRQVSSQTPPPDPYCGATNVPLDAHGNPVLGSATYCSGTACQNSGAPDYFTQNPADSVANPLYDDLLSSGASANSGAWQVLTDENYLLPLNAAPNPCAD